MLLTIKRLLADESGASAAEYAVLTALVLAAVIAGVLIFTTGLSNLFTMISTYMDGLSL